MKYVAIFMPDLLYMDDKVGDFHFIWYCKEILIYKKNNKDKKDDKK